MSEEKIERAVDLLHELSANFPDAISKVIPKERLAKVANELASVILGEGDEYGEIPREVRQLQKQIEFLREDKTALVEKIEALKQADATRQEIFTGRIDQLLQEMHVLKQERTELYEQVARAHEAEEVRDQLLLGNAEIKNTYQTIMIENDRLRKTNAALTQQVFHQEGLASLSRDGRVLDVLTGREDIDQEKLLLLLANLHQEMIDERLRFESQIEALHARLQVSERVDRPVGSATGTIGSAVNNIAYKMSDFLHSPKQR